MRKLIPVLLLTFSGSFAFSQSSSDRIIENKDNSFAESLRHEILSGIKKKIATDTAMQKSNEAMNEYYKACGLSHSVQKAAATEPSKVFKTAPDNLAMIVMVLNSTVATKKD
jgi:hypothetical protein